ncbi:MAG: hypothetical protein ACKV2T_01880 [Kofleriaceae bacterium]
MRWPSHSRRAFAAAALVSVFLALLYWLDQRGWNPSLLRMAGESQQLAAYIAVAASAFVCALAPTTWRREILLVSALVIAPLVLGAWSLLVFAFVAFVIGVARAPGSVPLRIAIVGVAWAALPVARVYWLGTDAQVATILVMMLWTGQLYSAIYLIVERAREPEAERTTARSDAFYLLAPPRLIVPFFQPISPRQLAAAIRPEMPLSLLKRSAGLAGYALLVAVATPQLGVLAERQAYYAVEVAITFVHVYARMTFTIFLAIALFRLLGFNLRSGFDAPFLSRSFAEFFRRFNYYVRDAVLSLFYYPLLGHLRTKFSPRVATIISAYVAILVGSFLLHDVLVPMSLTIAPHDPLRYYLDPVRVAGFFVLWTLIIVPTAGIAPTRPPPMSRTKAILAIALFNVVYFALWYAQHVGRGHW